MNESVLIKGPITPEMIDLMLRRNGEQDDTGAQVVFLGRVRADNKGVRRVRAIEYKAYESMVNREAREIRHAILSEFGDVRDIEILHSAGIILSGSVSVLVVVSGVHRHQAQEACRKTVELIKKRFPVWKREIFDDNSTEWVQDHTV